ncbi:prenyl protein specific carboxyl methyltransferase [Trypanosoma brucei gambiense DAL972]|uniref:Protein-S-isoprenylcysteine O-methyltransferase n=2 Tax=Trypanosoma brucei TaxID=5691 RepID=C9ZZ50_TRYB9|nr:prenyl protein specific carboxyl methyltransferase [Trypanosoma brucei gambiense DAL972]RHW70227.1 prenyl protein specific carboxyl methyltransferase [Trypanosoma brucei equiperdum]CBH14699.1 prenyl protein specific carboxyl methyltransferase [Trypanosoma brucei gambiense DAL972]|eukprot:XP_011776965.1 prenyl protein specific carboxyl methyltransferase [Trypanosoma brucei gambiense DAL972]
MHWGYRHALEVALISFYLGVCFTLGVSLMIHSVYYTGSVAEYAVGAYVISSIVLFHMSEFLVAVYFLRHDAHPGAFMIFHSREYTVAGAAAWLEFFTELFFCSEGWKVSATSRWGWLFRLNYTMVNCAAVLTIFFYLVRVCGMAHCGCNFSLLIETRRRSNHVLVTDGIYSILRHPAYFGYFWTALFSQLVLANPFCFMAYAIVLIRFFKERITYEETVLSSVEFFGESYTKYKAGTWVGIPFIR